MKILKKHVAAGAFHNSNERFDPPKCHPNTRTVILNEIMSWVENSHTTSTPIMWLYGPAGAGKSAIVQTIAEECNARGWLAASFFFSRTAAERNNEKRLVPTIAYQLTLSISGIRSFIEKAVEDDPLIFSRSLEAQLTALIAIPLFKIGLSKSERSWPMLIAIDGLDECHGDVAQRSILEVIFSALDERGLLFSALVASRPEQIIRQTFNRKEFHNSSHHLVLNDSYHPEADIKRFLDDRFDVIKKNHPLKSFIPDSWPLQTDIETLVRKSSGQFIYASTVIKYIDSTKHRPLDRLKIILGISSPGRDTPFAQLDALYKQILLSADDVHCVLQILGGLLLMSSQPEYVPTPRFLEILLHLREGEVTLALSDLHSILHVPDSAEQGPIRILHASLGDFLFDRSRSGELFIDTERVHTELGQCCAKHFHSRNQASIVGTSSAAQGTKQRTYNYSVTELVYHAARSLPTQALLDDIGLVDFTIVKALTKKDAWKDYLLDLLSWCRDLKVYLCITHLPHSDS
jgi:NACHT domain